MSAAGRIELGLEERYLSKANALDGAAGEEREQENHVALFAQLRVDTRLRLLARLPLAYKRITEAPLGDLADVTRSHGLGDAELLGSWRALTAGPVAFSLLGGVTAPTGPNDRKGADGERLDAHLQPGSGAWSGLVGVDAGASALGGRVDANVSYRFNGRNAHGYRYGDALLVNAGYAQRVGMLEWRLQANARTAAQDRGEDGLLGNNTGGTVVYAAPGAQWSAPGGVTLDASVQIPAAQSLDGIQKEHTTARFAVSIAR